MYILKISYETVVFVSFMCLVSYCFSFSFYYCILYMYLIVCFGGPIRCLKIAGVSIEGRTLAVFNGSFPLIWILLWRTLPVRPANDNRDCPHCLAEWEKVGDVAAVAPSSFLNTAILGTNTRFVLKYFFSSSVLFDR